MSLALVLALQAATVPDDGAILVTASRVPVETENMGVSATVIDEERIEALGEVQAIDLLRITPGVSVSVTGSRGTQAQVRIRGAEANHSLLFVDGIAFNDPAGGNEARFENFAADGLGNIEIIRGPQSALWGSEALGGVIALQSSDPLGGTEFTALAEYGSRDSLRGALSGTVSGVIGGITLTANHAETDGIDILGGGTGDRDGYENTTLALLGILRPGTNGELGIAARYIDTQSDFDGTDPVFFTRADTLDSSNTETIAVRSWVSLGIDPAMPVAVTVSGEYLTSDNRNFNAGAPLNQTEGDRFRISGQVEYRLHFGATQHSLIAVYDREDETFRARDQQFFGATNQDRSRGRNAFVGEWQASWSGFLSTDVAIRHDDFNRFDDATTLRASAIIKPTERLSFFGSYGEGIAQPTFFDLFGFFPGSFVGNPNLRPEQSQGYELGIAWREERYGVSVTAFQAELEDEIVSIFNNMTFLSSTANATGESERRGVEVAAQFIPVEGFRVDVNYTYTDADDQQVAGGTQVREVRRPKHSANVAFDYRTGPLAVGGSIAWVGERIDTDFDLFPAQTVTLDDYFLASARIAYAITDNVEIYARATNLFDEEYQDVVGYRTPGRAVYGGLRLRFGE